MAIVPFLENVNDKHSYNQLLTFNVVKIIFKPKPITLIARNECGLSNLRLFIQM